jgi:hypothetical protein
MRRVMVIFLLLVYCASQTGVLVWYYGKNLIHALSTNWQSIKTTIDRRSDLSQIKMDTAVYHKRVKEQEITLNENLYDITKTTFKGGAVYLTLEKDALETYLLEEYNQLSCWLKKHHPSKKSEQFVLNWMMKLFFSASFTVSSQHTALIIPSRFGCHNKYFPASCFEIPPKPPESGSSHAVHSLPIRFI